jgi:endonuclease/exonuclease/phosphatase family metal-dependent hydrolase
VVFITLFTGLAASAASSPATTKPSDLRVMSFNIRLATPKDLDNGWPFRKELLFRTIEAFAPDLLGTQEVLPAQGDDLKARLKSAYEFVGVPREDGKSKGEMAAVFFRRERFEKVRDGTFWLSETPDKVGSKGWDAQLPRVVTWVELKDHGHDDARVFFFNTHFDHIGKQARIESAKLMRAKILELAGPDASVVVTGDFNAPQYSPPYKALLGEADAPLPLVETFKEAHPKPTSQDWTFHGFFDENKRPDRIDWILRSPAFGTVNAEIDRTKENGRYPSDHYPVTAVLRYK